MTKKKYAVLVLICLAFSSWGAGADGSSWPGQRGKADASYMNGQATPASNGTTNWPGTYQGKKDNSAASANPVAEANRKNSTPYAVNHNPPLLSDYPLPPPRANPDSNLVPGQSGNTQPNKEASVVVKGKAPEKSPPTPEKNSSSPVNKPMTKEEISPEATAPDLAAGKHPEALSAKPAEAEAAEEPEPPTPEAVEAYQRKLAKRLLDRYNNQPDFAGKVARVDVVLSKPLKVSLDGRFIQAEFDQLVYDSWGRRLPQLEKEYYIITFGSGGAEAVRSEPSVRVGLEMERVFSEQAPLAGDPFKKIAKNETFNPVPGSSKPMPDWWRPTPIATPALPDHIN